MFSIYLLKKCNFYKRMSSFYNTFMIYYCLLT